MQVLAVLRGKEGQLLAISTADLDDVARRILGREARLAWKQMMEQSTPELSMERRELANKVAVLEQLDKEMRLLNRQLLQVNLEIAAVRSPSPRAGAAGLYQKGLCRAACSSRPG